MVSKVLNWCLWTILIEIINLINKLDVYTHMEKYNVSMSTDVALFQQCLVIAIILLPLMHLWQKKIQWKYFYNN